MSDSLAPLPPAVYRPGSPLAAHRDDPTLSALEDADCRLGIDPQRVAALGPSLVAKRWRAIRARLLSGDFSPSEARAELLAAAGGRR